MSYNQISGPMFDNGPNRATRICDYLHYLGTYELEGLKGDVHVRNNIHCAPVLVLITTENTYLEYLNRIVEGYGGRPEVERRLMAFIGKEFVETLWWPFALKYGVMR